MLEQSWYSKPTRVPVLCIVWTRLTGRDLHSLCDDIDAHCARLEEFC